MKKFFLLALCFSFYFSAQANYSVVCTAGGLGALFPGSQADYVDNLTVTGTIDARDFVFIQNMLYNSLTILDLSGATIAAYTGSEGTNGYSSTGYLANEIPQFAFVIGGGTN